MGKELVIGLDIGTTSVKAVIFYLKGALIAEAEALINTYYPHPEWAEQNPVEIERSSVLAMKEVILKAKVQKDEILTVGISCGMHSLICVDENSDPLSQMIIWSDGRSSAQAEKLSQSTGKEIYLKTGTPIHPMSPLIKLMWMKETNNEAYQKAAYFMSMKEYLLQKWFDKRVIDYSMASATGLFNLETYKWDDKALEIAGINKDQLSEIVPPTEILTDINEKIAEEMGLSSQVPFVIGAADGQLANLGNGAISPGEVAVSVGTSGAIRQFTKGVPVNEKQETFTYAFTSDTSIIGGATNNGGIALQWLKDLLEFQGSHDELLAGANDVEPGSDGILFLPYVNGERAPVWNQHAKGNFYGLSIGHKKEHLVRAVLEGITFNLYQIGKSLEEIAGKPEKISVNGGLTKSSLWVQIMADVFGKEIHLSDTHHNAAWGAAWTALVGIGKVGSFEEIKKNLPAEKVVQPNRQNHEVYLKVYEKYEAIAKNLAVYFE
ncbi:gluconate kinase [Virgibacillus profundi]|uniref:Gluconate kinase n=1 Tax=Virgibacillus profundi TaxID=2024555 RepID=A0A2A2IG35_9BACI|nr:gluconokinase [Virgibacillus profundi]PAV30617.1 gluconate kinase [Virgibacillus profundi]PXY54789.1 gluconate kinase [Virgibacillus profundi]